MLEGAGPDSIFKLTLGHWTTCPPTTFLHHQNHPWTFIGIPNHLLTSPTTSWASPPHPTLSPCHLSTATNLVKKSYGDLRLCALCWRCLIRSSDALEILAWRNEGGP